MTVGDLQSELGIDSSGTSQHLSAMRRQGILEARKEGTSVFYRVRDPRIFQMLESARQVIGSHLEEANALLGELGEPAPTAGRSTAKSRSRSVPGIERVGLAGRRRRRAAARRHPGAAAPGVGRPPALALQALGVALLGACGPCPASASPRSAPASSDGLEPAHLGIDGLSGFFLAAIAMVAVPALLYARGYLAGAPRARSRWSRSRASS